MIRELAARVISDARPLIDQLIEQEALIAEAKKRKDGDRSAQRRAENAANELRRQWLSEADPSLVYLYLSATGEADGAALRTIWQAGARSADAFALLKQWRMDAFYDRYWGDINVDLTPLPACSFTLRFTFTLAQPYLSKDDNPFYVIDNPIVRDRVFGLPLVRPSSWKGNLASALRQLGQNEGDAPWQRLFGKVNEANDESHAGRLFFYPTFFTQTGLEIINPHDRARRVGKNPILFESVPIGAKGAFTLLYVPFDCVGEDERKIRQQAAKDLVVLAEGLRAMFTVYGFSAKRTSGFGLAKETVSGGVLTCRIARLSTAAPSTSEPALAPAQDLPRYLEASGRLKPEYLTADGTFRDRSEAELKAMKKADRQLYDKAKAWWEREGKALAEQGLQPTPAVAVPPPAPTPAWPSWGFASFDELVTLAGQVAQQLITRGAQ